MLMSIALNISSVQKTTTVKRLDLLPVSESEGAKQFDKGHGFHF